MTPADVQAAATRLAGLVRRTPLWEVELRGRRVLLKAEHMQRSGSFKLRGATNTLLEAREAGAKGVVAASGGNHGLGIAVASRSLRLTSHVFLPASAPADKVHRIRSAGGTVHAVEGDYQEAVRQGVVLAEQEGLPFIPAFNLPAVIAGQGTAAAEVLEDRPDCDAIVVSVGGGGLLAGTTLAAAGRVAVHGVEPTGIPTVTRALAAGHPVDVTVDSVTASALGARTTAQVNLDVLKEWPAELHLVGGDAILRARDELWEEHRIAVEPAAGAALAGLLDLELPGELPCVVLCGANSGWTATP